MSEEHAIDAMFELENFLAARDALRFAREHNTEAEGLAEQQYLIARARLVGRLAALAAGDQP
jgi:hypothetical protein